MIGFIWNFANSSTVDKLDAMLAVQSFFSDLGMIIAEEQNSDTLQDTDGEHLIFMKVEGNKWK